MKRCDLIVGEVYAMRTSRDKATSPYDYTPMTYLGDNEPYPEIDADDPASHQHLTRPIADQYISPRDKTGDDRILGLLFETRDGHRRRRYWYNSARLADNTWAGINDQWSAEAARRLRTELHTSGCELPVPVAWSPDSTWYGLDWHPGKQVHIGELVDVAATDEHGRPGALCRFRGRDTFVAERHHLYLNADEIAAKARSAGDRQTAENAARLAAAKIADLLEFGRWAPTGNRYHDDARYADVPHDELPADAAWLTLRGGYAGTYTIGPEALLALITAPAGITDQIIATLEAAMAGEHADTPII